MGQFSILEGPRFQRSQYAIYQQIKTILQLHSTASKIKRSNYQWKSLCVLRE